jgi:hypothetical protein
LHDNSVYATILVIALSYPVVHPAVVLVERDGWPVGFRHFEEQIPLCRYCQDFQQGGCNPTTPPGGQYSQIQQFRLFRRGLAPDAKAHWISTRLIHLLGQQDGKSGIIRDGPLRRFGRRLLDAGNRQEVAIRGNSNFYGDFRLDHIPFWQAAGLACVVMVAV